jgi:hypothetical protein
MNRRPPFWNEWLRDRQPATVREFVLTYYRHDRLRGRDEECARAWPGYVYSEAIIASHEADCARQGYCFVTEHESKTGECVAYYSPEFQEQVKEMAQ